MPTKPAKTKPAKHLRVSVGKWSNSTQVKGHTPRRAEVFFITTSSIQYHSQQWRPLQLNVLVACPLKLSRNSRRSTLTQCVVLLQMPMGMLVDGDWQIILVKPNLQLPKLKVSDFIL